MNIKSSYPPPKKNKPKVNQEEIKPEEKTPVYEEPKEEAPKTTSFKSKKKHEEENDDLAKLLADLKEKE